MPQRLTPRGNQAGWQGQGESPGRSVHNRTPEGGVLFFFHDRRLLFPVSKSCEGWPPAPV